MIWIVGETKVNYKKSRFLRLSRKKEGWVFNDLLDSARSLLRKPDELNSSPNDNSNTLQAVFAKQKK